ncbi:hypothetical protein [Geothrix limicola]|uniref:hypothetical protein n=1 Tax=Geothrix limicola TaxID=2927978 RepID=UPI002554D963|nr:hypothetical protein [Geothrix limicola]
MTLMPQAVREVCAVSGLAVEALDLVLVRPGMNLRFTALDSGLHWGAALYRA